MKKEEFDKAVKEKSNELTKIEGKIAKSKADLVDLNKSLREQAEDIQKKKTAKSAELKEVIVQHDGLLEQINTLEDVKKSLECERLAMEAKALKDAEKVARNINKQTAKLKDVKSEASEQKDVLKGLVGQVQAKEKEINGLAIKQLDIKKETEKLKKQAKTAQTKINNAKTQSLELSEKFKEFDIHVKERELFDKKIDKLAEDVKALADEKAHVDQVKKDMETAKKDYEIKAKILDKKEKNAERMLQQAIEMRDSL